MKKLSLFIMLFLLIMAGCKVKEVEEPVVKILGDKIVTIAVGDQFVDPGAEIDGDFDLIIETDSNLDINVAGTYTITYSVTYEGKTYSEKRTVIVENPQVDEHDWVITIESKDITDTSITFTVEVNDTNDRLSNIKAILYKGTNIISEKVFDEGIQDFVFLNLNPETEYKLVLEADYTENGVNKKVVDQFLVASTLESFVAPTIELTNSEENITSIEVSIEVVDYGNSLVDSSVFLYNNDYEMESIPLNLGTNNIVFDKLSPAYTYTIQVEYSYKDNESSRLIEIISDFGDFTTLTPPKPVLVNQTCTVTTNSVVCTVEFNNSGFESDSFFYAQLYKNGMNIATTQITDSNTNFTFTDLEEQTDYVVHLQANYVNSSTQISYSDVTIDTIEFTTDKSQEIVVPSLSNLIITKTTNQVSVNYTLNDPNHIFVNGEARIYDSNQLLVDGQIIFNGTNTFTLSNNLIENTDYTFMFIISHYDNNSNIVQDITIYEETLSLPPTISLVDMVESDIVYTNTDMVLKITLNNPTGILINCVKINDVDYSSITTENNNSVIYVNIGNFDTIGDKTITLNSIEITLTDGAYDYLMDYTKTITVFDDNTNVPSDATIEILKVTTDNLMVEVEEGQTVTKSFTVHLRNEYNLQIDSMLIDGAWYETADLEIISPTLIRFTGVIHEGLDNDFGVYNVKFIKNGTLETLTQDYNNSVSVCGYNADDIIYIHNVSELLSIQNDLNGIYLLANDIDMTGVNFDPIGDDFGDFTGLFNGNGYTISNITMTRNVPNSNTYSTNLSFGLFGKSSGYIYNLVINNMTITVNSDPENTINVGTVVGYSRGVVSDVQVIGNSTVTVNNANNGSIGGLVGYNVSLVTHSSANANITVDAGSPTFYGSTYGIGGFVGNNYGNIEYSSATGDINVSNNGMLTSVQVGGLIGTVKDGSRISNSYSLGNVYNNGSFTGGLIGYVYNGTVYINYTYATGNVSGYQNVVGGLIGSTNTNTFVSNSFAVGNVTSVMGNPGALFGYENPYSIKNCFKYVDQVITKDGSVVTPRDESIGEIVAISNTNLETISFYTDNMLFTDLNWDFTDLDFSQGKLPKIK